MIDKHYYDPNPGLYFADCLLSLALFAGGFVVALTAGPLLATGGFVVSAFALYRAGAFIHEIAHRPTDPKLARFATFWNLVVGAIVLVPGVRFIAPHQTHHTVGVFGTPDDPQYLLVRSNRRLLLVLLVGVPLVMPLLNLLLVITSAFGGVRVEEALERFFQKKGQPVPTALPAAYHAEAARLSRYYLVVFLVYAVLLPQTLPMLYAVQVAAWALTCFRIPLEHDMIRHAAGPTTRTDQLRDSFTVESPWAELVQPLSLRLHTAHHLYPGVPYHRLPALHRELKAKDPDYRASVISFWDALRAPGAARARALASTPPSAA